MTDNLKKKIKFIIHNKKKMNYLSNLLYHYKLLAGRVSPAERERVMAPVKIFTTTWNCGDFQLGSLGREPWLMESLQADIVAIGMQESRLDHAFAMINEFYDGTGLVQLESISMWQVR